MCPMTCSTGSPRWSKSLYHTENELRNVARNGLILRKEEASEHLAEARRHLEQAKSQASLTFGSAYTIGVGLR